jgi:hypothetical protein
MAAHQDRARLQVPHSLIGVTEPSRLATHHVAPLDLSTSNRTKVLLLRSTQIHGQWDLGQAEHTASETETGQIEDVPILGFGDPVLACFEIALAHLAVTDDADGVALLRWSFAGHSNVRYALESAFCTPDFAHLRWCYALIVR